MIAIDIDVYSVFAVIFNILCLEVAYDSIRLFYWPRHLHYMPWSYLVLYWDNGTAYTCIQRILVLYCVLFYWYLLCSRKAHFYVIHRHWITFLLFDTEVYSVQDCSSHRVPYSGGVSQWRRRKSAAAEQGWLLDSVKISHMSILNWSRLQRKWVSVVNLNSKTTLNDWSSLSQVRRTGRGR